MIRSLFKYLDRRPRSFFWVAGIVTALLIGISEYLLGFGISVSIFNLVPISLAAWYMGRRAGAIFAFMAAFIWLAVDETSRNPFAHTYIPFWNTAVRLCLFLTVVFLLDGFKREKTYAREDYLTGLGNRRNFFELAGSEIERSRRYGHAFSFAYIDVDHFKSINDRYGHSEGDALLRSIADVMKSHVRSTDITARLGGDEFAVLLPESDSTSAESFFHKLHDLLTEMVRRNAWPVTFSIGVVTFEKTPGSIDDMIRIADRIMYTVKADGRNLVRLELFPGARDDSGHARYNTYKS